ncbi:MAG: deoxyribose-phosphate aldolase [Phycisphaerales bacterium]|nr:deoxyribose-phosphate aldolase [Phycisphaerales bacterium]
MTSDPQSLARQIDSTLLAAETTPDQIDRLCDDAIEHGFHSVFVNPIYVGRAVRRLEWSGVVVGSVAGFPLGADHADTVVDQARRVLDEGAREVDMVAWIGGIVAGDSRGVVETIHRVACVVHGGGAGRILKVILEAGTLNEEQIRLGCRCAAEGEADFVKTSTGFHKSGGATVEQVRLLHRCAAPLKVKASGGIRDLNAALAMLDAGAARIGTSSAVAIVDESRRHVAR